MSWGRKDTSLSLIFFAFLSLSSLFCPFPLSLSLMMWHLLSHHKFDPSLFEARMFAENRSREEEAEVSFLSFSCSPCIRFGEPETKGTPTFHSFSLSLSLCSLSLFFSYSAFIPFGSLSFWLDDCKDSDHVSLLKSGCRNRDPIFPSSFPVSFLPTSLPHSFQFSTFLLSSSLSPSIPSSPCFSPLFSLLPLLLIILLYFETAVNSTQFLEDEVLKNWLSSENVQFTSGREEEKVTSFFFSVLFKNRNTLWTDVTFASVSQ